MVIEVYYFGVRVHTETHNLCEELSCPVSAGNFVLSHTQTLPGITPPVNSTSENVSALLYCLLAFQNSTLLLRHTELNSTAISHIFVGTCEFVHLVYLDNYSNNFSHENLACQCLSKCVSYNI